MLETKQVQRRMIHLKSVAVKKWSSKESVQFPFNLPVLQSLGSLEFTSPVTFFVGENGSGKSTLMEALACAAGSITVGSESIKTDKSLADVRKFSRQLQLSWSRRTHRGFFLRAEDFFGFARKMAQTKQEMEEDIKAVDRDYKGRSQEAIGLAKSSYARELAAMQHSYGEGLDVNSHGESFLKLFQARFVPDGFYLLDEPEAPLSPNRQLAFLAALKQMVAQDSQFIIATHSPIIMAFPGAVILSFDGARVHEVAYRDLEHVSFTKAFLNNPEAFLRHL